MSTKLLASFASYDHPFFGSFATRIRMYPSASQSGHRITSRTRPFTGNAASNSRPDLIGRGTAVRTAGTPIKPTTRDFKPSPALPRWITRGSDDSGRIADPQLPQGGRGPRDGIRRLPRRCGVVRHRGHVPRGPRVRRGPVRRLHGGGRPPRGRLRHGRGDDAARDHVVLRATEEAPQADGAVVPRPQ